VYIYIQQQSLTLFTHNYKFYQYSSQCIFSSPFYSLL